jgi:purine-binding chemotaxis protein CheW
MDSLLAELLAEDALPDAGLADAGLTDAGLTDAGFTPALMTEAGLTASGLTEVELADAGMADVGPPGARLIATGLTEGGLTESGLTANLLQPPGRLTSEPQPEVLAGPGNPEVAATADSLFMESVPESLAALASQVRPETPEPDAAAGLPVLESAVAPGAWSHEEPESPAGSLLADSSIGEEVPALPEFLREPEVPSVVEPLDGSQELASDVEGPVAASARLEDGFEMPAPSGTGPQAESPREEPPLAVAEDPGAEVLSDMDLLSELPEELDFAGPGEDLVEEPTELLLESIAPPEPVVPLETLSATDEMFAEMMADADSILGDVTKVEENPPVAVGPQPALEDVIRAIDRELRNAPRFSLVADAPSVSHRQYSQLDDYVVFSLCGSDYAVPVRDIAEIGSIPAISRIPNVPEFVRGLTNLRGEVVPVLSLQLLLGVQDAPSYGKGRVLFLQSRDGIAATALLVDDVKGIQRIPSQQLEQVTGLMDDKVTSVLRGVHGRGDRLLNILDLEQLFRLQEIRQLENR